MGKLRLFGHDWKIRYDKKGLGSWYNPGKSSIGIDDSEPNDVVGEFFHELMELILYDSNFRFVRNTSQDPSFFMSHIELDEFARKLSIALIDNGLISEKKIRKLIEEK